MTSLEQQVISFLVTVALGLIMGAIFDFYYVLRRLIKPKKIFVHIGDLLIWLFMIVLVFAALIYTNWGEVRFYIFLGIALGILIYYILFSRYLKTAYKFLLTIINKTFRVVLSVILFPFRIIAKVFLYLVGLISIVLMWVTKPVRNAFAKSSLAAKLKNIKLKLKSLANSIKKIDPFKRL